MIRKSSIPVRSTNKALKNNALLHSGPSTRPKNSPSRSILHTEFKKFKAQSMLSTYKPAKLYKGQSYWYAYYYFQLPGTTTYQRFKEYLDINRIHNKGDKLLYGQQMVKFINQKLAEGFNPFLAAGQAAGDSAILIVEQLEQVKKKILLNASASMTNTYTSFINRFKKFLEKEQYEELVMLQIGSDVIDKFQRWMKDALLARKTINANISHLALVWDEAKVMKMVVANPFREIKPVKKETRKPNEEDIFEPLTFEELKAIVNHMSSTARRNYLRYLMMIYLAWARPVEIFRLQVGQIDLKSWTIKFKKGKTKNHAGAFVQIIPMLRPYLMEMNLRNYPTNFFLFSKDNYMPGPAQRDPKTALKTWGKVVNDEMKINKRMYALKHTGNIEYLLQNKGNLDLKWMQMQNRHSSAAMTERYIRKLGAYFIDVEQVKFREL